MVKEYHCVKALSLKRLLTFVIFVPSINIILKKALKQSDLNIEKNLLTQNTLFGKVKLRRYTEITGSVMILFFLLPNNQLLSLCQPAKK